LSYQLVPPGYRFPFGPTHKTQEGDCPLEQPEKPVPGPATLLLCDGQATVDAAAVACDVSPGGRRPA
jgi:hypothetical protein